MCSFNLHFLRSVVLRMRNKVYKPWCELWDVSGSLPPDSFRDFTLARYADDQVIPPPLSEQLSRPQGEETREVLMGELFINNNVLCPAGLALSRFMRKTLGGTSIDLIEVREEIVTGKFGEGEGHSGNSRSRSDISYTKMEQRCLLVENKSAGNPNASSIRSGMDKFDGRRVKEITESDDQAFGMKVKLAVICAVPFVFRLAFLKDHPAGYESTLYLSDNLAPTLDQNVGLQAGLRQAARWSWTFQMMAWLTAGLYAELNESVKPLLERTWLDRFHGLFHPVYLQLGFVVKYFLDGSAFGHELMVHQALSSLKHIPTLIAQGSTTSGIPFLVTSYCGTGVNDALTQAQVEIIYREIVKPMHHLGWHHHDLRLDNITRDRKGRVHVIDFDLAVRATECEGPCPDLGFVMDFGADALRTD
ncbi:hypothetical protein MD484_g6072, partial [Candolleomyces efflorescens]